MELEVEKREAATGLHVHSCPRPTNTRAGLQLRIAPNDNIRRKPKEGKDLVSYQSVLSCPCGERA